MASEDKSMSLVEHIEELRRARDREAPGDPPPRVELRRTLNTGRVQQPHPVAVHEQLATALPRAVRRVAVSRLLFQM